MENIEIAKVINAFCEYRKSGNRSLVDDFKSEQVKTARDIKVHPDNDHFLWQIMTGWIEEHERSKRLKRVTHEKWIFAIVAFALGILGTLLSQLLANLLFRP